MARRVIIRSRELNTAVAQLEEMVARDYKEIWKEHIDDLEFMAEIIVEDAQELVPLDTGKLQRSIQARVSKSPRYPGLIVSASAKDHGYDYALIQEENEDFSHDEGRQAHYLSEPFYNILNQFYEQYTGQSIEYPDIEDR